MFENYSLYTENFHNINRNYNKISSQNNFTKYFYKGQYLEGHSARAG
jgi:hypothetical protein